MAIDPLASYWSKQKFTDLYSVTNTSGDKTKLLDQALIGLDESVVKNYNSLLTRFPNQSKDYLISAAKIGLNANTKGIEKLSANDGISQLKQDLINIDNIKSEAEKNKDFRDAIWSTLKGTSRVGFAALQAPYQYLTTIGRDLYSLGKKDGVSGSQLLKDISIQGLFGETTNLGQLLNATAGVVSGKGPVDTGSGFFVSPESKVGAGQAKAMSAYGRINGKSFTLGRATMNSLGADPNSTPYRVMSGIVDATLNIATDPSTWVGPGSVSKIITKGKQASAAKTAAQNVIKAEEDAIQAAKIADIKNLNKEDKALIKQRHGTEKKVRRTVENTYLKAEKDLAKVSQSTAAALTSRLEKALNYFAGRGSKVEGDAEVASLIGDGQIGDFVIKNIAEQKPEGLISSIAQLEADYINTGKTFTGIYFDEVPEAGKLSLGAFDGGEYVATVSKNQPLNLIDISKTYENSTLAERAAEVERRGNFFEQLFRYTEDPNIPDVTRQAIDDFIGKTPNKTDAMKATVDDMIFGQGSESLAVLINRAIATKNEHLIQYVSEAIQTTYKVDGFTNVRAINNGIGGTVVTNGAKVGARRVGITDVLTSLSGQADMGTQLGAKLIASVKNVQEEYLTANSNFERAVADRASIDGKIKEIDILRDYAAADPDLVKQLLNDPENIGIAKLMDLEMEIADTQYAKEFYKSEVGLIDRFGGSPKGDLNKAATYLLGKRFTQIAEIVAKEKDFYRLHGLFGRKLDVEMTKELVDATTSDEVLSIFLKHLAAPTSDLKIYRSLTLRGEAAKMANNPLFKVVSPVPLGAIKYAEQVERKFGRYFTRSIILPLDDLDRLVNGMEDWMSSARIPDDIIASSLNKIIKATSVQERSGIVFREIGKVQEQIAQRLAPGDKDLLESIKTIYRASGRESALIKQYSVAKLTEGAIPNWNLFDGKKLPFGKNTAILEHQFLDDVIKLPDTQEIAKLINQYNKNKAIGGTRNALATFNTSFGERWRTAQLAFRIAYIMRNIGEMQFRQYFSGHDSIFNHPLGYLAMVFSDPKGGPAKKFLASIEKYGNDVEGNKLIKLDKEVDTEVSAFVKGQHEMMSRNTYSGDARFSYVENLWEKFGPEDNRYHLGLANTIIRFRSDELIPLVANTVEGTEDDVVKYVIEKKLPILEAMIQGGRNGIEGDLFAQGFLKDLTKNADGRYNVSVDNIQFENVKSYLFDRRPDSVSVIREIDGLAGTGPHSNAIRKMLTDEFATAPSGKTIRIPGFQESGNINDLADQTSGFKAFLSRNYKAEEMTNSTVLHARQEKVGMKQFGFLDQAVEKFFDLGTKLENVWNFSPEFRMSYWDYVGRYVNMVNDDALDALLINAKKSLAPLTVKGRNISLRRHPSLRAINKEIAARKKGKSITDGIDLQTMNNMAGEKATEYTKNLFYDAAKQRQHAAALRSIFPFIQAQFNTIYKWGELFSNQPVKFYKLGKTYNALLQPGSSAIYDLTATKYDENQGFFYKDEFGETRFRYPLAGSIIGAMAGKSIQSGSALQITAPVQSLNLAFGAVNPAIPGIGPMGQIIYAASGKSKAFGPEWDSLRQIIFPFGEPNGVQDLVLPSWMKKSFLTIINNDTQVERGVKDWAGYLASTGDYGDDPLANDSARNQLFNDARGLSRWSQLMTAFFQSIAPATPSQEVFAKDKNGVLRTQTFLYNAYDQISKKYPGDYFGAIGEFADTFGIKNLLPVLANSTRNVRGTGDAWSFLNNNPDMADKYATKTGDIVPYFFPGGEAATAYYNWQKATGRRRPLRPEELEQYAENVVYQMAKSQISEEQVAKGYTAVWYSQEIIKLNNQFGGNAPVLSVDIGSAEDKIANVGKALAEPAFQASPIYKETAQFYTAYQDLQKYLQETTASATPGMGSGNWLARRESEKLNGLALQLMIQNPAFARMYYGVFASKLKVEE